MKHIELDQKVQTQLDLYKKSFFTLVVIVFTVMLLNVLQAPFVYQTHSTCPVLPIEEHSMVLSQKTLTLKELTKGSYTKNTYKRT